MAWLSIAATVFSMVSSMSKGKDQASQYEAYAQANQYNAAIKRQRAETTMQLSAAKEAQAGRIARITGGSRRAAAGEAGVGFGGSTADIERQSQVLAEMDALNIRYEGVLQRDALLADANLDEYNAGLNLSSAGHSTIGGYLGAAGSLLSGYGGYIKNSDRTGPLTFGYNSTGGNDSFGIG